MQHDTLMHDALREIPRRFASIDLGLFHLGGTRILGLTVTMDARQGAEALMLIDPQVSIPIHYDDYPQIAAVRLSTAGSKWSRAPAANMAFTCTSQSTTL